MVEWVRDFCQHCNPMNPQIAVLVHDSGLAERMARDTCMQRTCNIGQEVGLGTGSSVLINKASSVVFMSYGFFKSIRQVEEGSLHIKWGAVIVVQQKPEPEADVLFVTLADKCKSDANRSEEHHV